MEFSKNKVWNTAWIVVLLNLFIVALSAFYYRNDSYGAIGIFLILGGVIFLEFFVGLILAIKASTRPIGQGILLGSGLVLLFGLGVCTVMAFGFSL
jgi:hypothetical protein